jgi:hypothetical protein
MKPVVHARPETESDELASPMTFNEPFIAKQILHTVWEALRLNRQIGLHRAEGADQGIAWTRDDVGIRVDVPDALAKFANKAIAKACKISSLGFVKPEVVEEAPGRH